MSERPEWMPSNSEIALSVGDDLYRDTGLRAQIAVLEELNPHTEQIYNKIAALRKELGE